MYEKTIIEDITGVCKTEPYGDGLCVMYKDVPLWYTIYSENPSDIENCTINIILDQYDLSDDGEVTEDTVSAFTIIGKTPVIGNSTEYDYTTYGDWVTANEVYSWLENPVPLY